MSAIRGTVMPLVGLSAFWTCFRYQGFLVGMFPYGAPLSPAGCAFLLALAVLVCVGLARWRALSRLLSDRPQAAFATTLPGVLGAFARVCWPAMPEAMCAAVNVLIATGLFVCFLMWTGYVATGPESSEPHKLTLAVAAYALSVACMYGSYQLLGADASTHLAPWRMLVCAGAWLATRQSDGSAAVRDAHVDQPVALVDLTDLFLGACATCILGGTVIRGVIDNGVSPAMSVRMLVVIILSIAVFTLVATAWPASRQLGIRLGGVPADPLGLAFSACWAVLAFAFLGGTLMYLAGIAATLGAYVATAACSLQLVLFYFLLADRARCRSVSFVPAFVVYGFAFWALCWLASYLGVTSVVAEAGALAGNAMVLVATLAVIASGVAVLGMLLLRGPSAHGPHASACDATTVGMSETSHAGAEGSEKDWRRQLDAIERELGSAYGLTAREAQVAVMYASGYSLGRVAEELGITKGTAQGYSKAVYRKAGVHTKNELVDLCKELGGR